eukprot:scaffold14789_cov105-Isochrysis_galbana.AAC.2
MGGRGDRPAGSARYGGSKAGSEQPNETEMRGPAEGPGWAAARDPQCMALWVKTTHPPGGSGQARMD